MVKIQAAAHPRLIPLEWAPRSHRVIRRYQLADFAPVASREVTVETLSSTELASTALRMMVGAVGTPMIELDRRAAYRVEVTASGDHPLQDALTRLVNLLIQTPNSVRHLWLLG